MFRLFKSLLSVYFSMLSPQYIGEIVNRNALAHNLKPEVVMAMVLQESTANPFAVRYERRFYYKYIDPLQREELKGWKPEINTIPSLDTEKTLRATSFGLLQVMGSTAREIGDFKEPFLTKLLDPEIGVDVGCRVLSHYLGLENGDYRRALARYNAGSVTSIGLEYASKIQARIQNKEHVKYLA